MIEANSSLELVHSWLEGKSLIHPLSTEKPTTIEFFAALRDLCGTPAVTTTAAAEEIEDFIGHKKKNIVVIIAGLGDSLIDNMHNSQFFAKSERKPLVTGFPSSFAPLFTSFLTASWPGEHGVLGENTYYREYSRTLNVMKGKESATNISCSDLGIAYQHIIPTCSWLNDRHASIISLIPDNLEIKPFYQWISRNTRIDYFSSLKQARKKIAAFLRKKSSEEGLALCYITNVKEKSEQYGCQSDQAVQEIFKLDAWLEHLHSNLPLESNLLVIGDHGMISIPQEKQYVIKERDFLMQYLLAPPSGEITQPFFHVIPGQEEAFTKHFYNIPAGKSFTLLNPQDVERLHLLSPELLCPGIKGRMGTFIGISREPASIEYVCDNKPRKRKMAFSGGLRKEEMNVSLYKAGK